jgi:hypothetical protein
MEIAAHLVAATVAVIAHASVRQQGAGDFGLRGPFGKVFIRCPCEPLGLNAIFESAPANTWSSSASSHGISGAPLLP